MDQNIFKNISQIQLNENGPEGRPGPAGFLREALFTSGSAKLDRVCLCVSVSVRIIIDFCEWDMEGDEALLLIGRSSLNYAFGRSEHKLKQGFKNKQ